MANQTVYAARMQFNVTNANTMYPVIFGSSGTVEVRKSKPRWVADIRYMQNVGVEAVMRAHDRFFLKWARSPDTIRVHPSTRANLLREAGVKDADNLSIYGIKVTL